MSTDNNSLELKINPKQQVADGDSSIQADATAYINNGGVISYPDPSVTIIFELPDALGAVFKDTKTTTTSRQTLVGSGRIDKAVYFSSGEPIENGMLTAYWENDKENTLQKTPFTFTPLFGYIQQLPSNFAPADGSSYITLQVGLLGQGQEATISFNEKTKTVTFDPPSVKVQSGQTATTNATCNVPGAYFVTTDVGTVEIDFIAKGQLTSTELSVSSDRDNPTQLTLANDFEDIWGLWRTFYMQLPQFKDYTFASLSFSSTEIAAFNSLYFSTSYGSVVDPDSNNIPLPDSSSDMNPLQYYVGAFYSKEKNLWRLYGSDNAIFGLG